MPTMNTQSAAGILDLAREIEQATPLLRTAQSHLQQGPYARTRSRMAKQLRKLDAVLDRIQRASLSGPLDPLVTSFVRDEVAALLPRLEEVVQEPLQKARLKDVRRAVKRTRMVIAAHLDEMK